MPIVDPFAAPAAPKPLRIVDPFAAPPQPADEQPAVPQIVDPFEAARRAEFAPVEEFTTGVKRAATVDLPSLWENAKVLKDAGAASTVIQRMDVFNKIDSGEITSPDQLRGLDITTSQARSYLAASPEMRAKLKERLTNELGKRKEFINASLETLKAYQEAGGQLKPRVDKLTEIENPTDFVNWLSSNVGSGAVNLAPIILAAATTGPAGLLATGVGMGTAESVGNRLDALQKKLADTPPEQRAQVVMDRLKETGGTDLAVGIVSGALDSLLGPAASAAKFAARDVLKQTRTGAAKAALKATPREMGEEFITGGLQSLTQTAGKVSVGEQEKFLTKQTFIDALNDAAAEAAGAPAGSAFNAARAALAAGKSPREARRAAQEQQRRTVLDTLSEEDYVTEPDTTAGGAGVGVAGAAGPAVSAPRVEGAEPTGVVSPEQLAGEPTGREATQPSAIIPLDPEFRRQYNDLRGELLGLMSLSSPTQADLNQMRLVKKDLDALIDSNAEAINAASGDPRLTQAPSKKFALTLKNPMFNGDQLLSDIESLEAPGAPRAMAGDLFGGRADVIDLPNRALLIAGQDPVKAVSYLQGLVQRTRERMPAISADTDWGRRMAPTVGMTAREGFENPAKVAELFAAQQEKKVADAVSVIEGRGKARGMAGFLFGEQATANDLLKQALTASRDDPERAIQQLQTLQKRTQDQLPELSQDREWGRKTARLVGMTEQEGAADPAKVARLFTAQRSKAISEAIDAARGLEAQGEMFGAESEDKATQERTRAETLSREIEARSKDSLLAAGASMSPQERVSIYTAEQTRLMGALKEAQEHLAGLKDRASRVGQGRKPTALELQGAESAVSGLTRSLQDVSRELAKAQTDVASGVTTPARKETPASKKPVTGQRLAEATQPQLFTADEAAIDALEKLFEPKKPAAPTEEFGAPVEGEAPAPTAEQMQAEAEQEQRRREAKELVRAPEVSTERVLETPAGQIIKRFFDLIQPANRSQSELSKHQASKNAAANTLLEYDIARPGQKDLPGLMKALDYLVQKVGGKDKFAALLESLDGASPSEQANLLRRAGLPDLTSRRGIDSFRDTVQREVQEMTVRGEGVRLPTRSTPSKITGTPIPYREEINTGVSEYVFREPEQGTGKPRRPTMRQLARQFVISDTKVRTAARILRDLIDTGSKMSDPAQAAATYFSNPVRSTFGEALNDLAFDLAMREIEPDNYGAGSTFPGEGGKYALQFQEWIKTNLDQNTVELLNELVEMHSKTARENAKYEVAVSNYKQAEREYAEQQRQKAEKTSGVKLPKAPKRVSERVPETEAGEQEAEPEAPKVPAKNLPRRQGLYEVHPAIKRALEKGDTRKALELISQAKGNPYYALLADRLLAANITAKTTFIDQDTLQALNEPNNDTFNNYIDTLSEMVVEMYPVDQQAGLVTLLKSERLRDVTTALAEMRATLTTTKATDGQIKVFNEAVTYFNQQYGWIAKYDPNTDTLVFRQGTGLTNATFLHEVLHAATSAYLDNPNALTGVQRQGYDQLMELYNYSKGMLAQNGFAVDHIYGLNDIHEFVSEALTNPEFQAQLRALRYKASPFSLANWFTEGIRKLFNIKKGYESNVLNEIIFASDAMMLGTTAGKEKLTGTTGAKAAPGPRVPSIPKGRPNIPGANKAMFNALLKPKNWNQVRPLWPVFYANLKSNVRPGYLGGLTLDQIADLVDKRLPQFAKFARTVENFLARKNSILTEAADISKRWEQLQARDAGMSAKLADVMSAATIREFDPDPLVPSTAAERAKNADVLNMWRGLNPEARAIYREVRDFYEQRYSEYRRTLNRRLMSMAQYGVSTQTINDIRAEFDKAKRKGPYFPLMRHGSLAYQIGSGRNREYYMFESLGEMELHMQQRLAADPHLRSTIQPFYDYKEAMDAHARESNFLRGTFDAIESANFGAATPQEEAAHKQALKDNVYQTWLTNQPESSFRNRFIHRSNVAGYSQDALRNFASSSFHMAYQLSRFEYSQDMFSQLQAAKQQIKARVDPANPADPVVMRENKELSDYVKDADRRLDLILNPTDVGTIPSTLTNIGFIWYMTSFASAAFNVVGGMAIALPTLVGQNVRENANKSYSRATLEALGQMKTVFGQIMMSGFDYETGPRIRDFALKSPSLQRAQDRYVTVGGRTFQVASGLSRVDQAAYNRFVADGLIDITGTYDMSGLAATPTEDYSGARNKTMQVLSYLFHNAERLNREIVAMSAFRLAMEKRAGMANRQQAFAESIAEAKATTNASMFNYSSTNKPRWFQHPAARVVLQFKQFPQQMTWFLSRSLWKSFAAADPAIRREARARFVGTMGMTAIFSGATGLWGFSTVAAIVNACAALFGGDDEEPFDFELEFKNWVGETFGKNLGTAISSGVFNAAGIDVASRVKLDDMWFRDGRKNQDEVDAVTTAMVDMMGPVPGLVPLVARAVQLWNEGHPNRALETIAPAFIKQPMIAYRYAKEGVNTLDGDPLMEDMGPFLLMMQSLGIRSAELAERQYYNITKKGQAEEIRKKRTNLLNGFAITFMSNDAEGIDKALDKIMEFNDKYPSVRIPMKSISRSIRERLEKSAQTDHGLFIDPRLRDVLLNERYMDDED